MKVLYVALKESLPGSHGGAVHVLEVARQLAGRGHDLTVLVQQKAGQAVREAVNDFELVRVPTRSNFLLFQLEPRVRDVMADFKPAVVMERYYNFAGAGLRAAYHAAIPSVLEVNAPMMDPKGSRKEFVDRLLWGWMTRRAREQAMLAKRIVTPLASTVPFIELRAKVREIPWGANVRLFDRSRLNELQVQALRAKTNPQNKRVVAFLGSFRPWHGVREFFRVAREIARARDDVLFLMIGSGELFKEIGEHVQRSNLQDRIILTGAVEYHQVPYYLALCDVGVAPFNTQVHPPLRVGFYWSPLKVHEYMAMGLPVVTIDVDGLNQIVRNEREGLLYAENDLEKMRVAILRLVEDRALAKKLGNAGRVRVVENFSWQKHAELLEGVLKECIEM